jgi:hypothetical protein
MSANRTIAFRPRRTPAGAFFHWESLDEPIAVFFHLNVIDVLERAAIRGGDKGTAGLLLGRRENGWRPTLIVEDIEPISLAAAQEQAASQFGDRSQWEPVINRWGSQSEKRMSIVGFYRTCSATDEAVSALDLEVLNANSRDLEQVLLLVNPRSEMGTSGSLFMIQEGEEAWAWDRIPFCRSELAPAVGINKPADAVEKDRFVEIPIAETVAEREEPAKSAKEPQRAVALRWIVGSAIGIVILVTLFVSLNGGQFLRALSTAPQGSDESTLGLKTQRNGGELQVSWNRSAQIFGKASGGHLLISDGIVHKSVDLDSSELRTGSISYTPLTDDVSLRLNIVNAEAVVLASESAHSVVGLLPPLPDLAGRSQDTASARTRATQPPVAPAAAKADPTRSADNSKPTTPALSLPAGQSERAALAPGSALPGSDALPREIGASAPTPMPIVPELKVAAPPPVFESMTTGAPAKAILRNDQVVVAAQLIASTNPVYSEKAKELKLAGTVKIEFRIGTDGKVQKITATDGPALLTQSVIDAVKVRRYKPASINGMPVESNSSMSYVFSLR